MKHSGRHLCVCLRPPFIVLHRSSHRFHLDFLLISMCSCFESSRHSSTAAAVAHDMILRGFEKIDLVCVCRVLVQEGGWGSALEISFVQTSRDRDVFAVSKLSHGLLRLP